LKSGEGGTPQIRGKKQKKEGEKGRKCQKSTSKKRNKRQSEVWLVEDKTKVAIRFFRGRCQNSTAGGDGIHF